MSKLTKVQFPTSFGVFSPTGHIVMVFETDDKAKKAYQALLDGGFDAGDVTYYRGDEVIPEFQRSEKHAASPLQIGQDEVKVAEFLVLAKQGCGFLVVHAPKSEQAKLAVTIARPYGLKHAEKYNHLTLEELA